MKACLNLNLANMFLYALVAVWLLFLYIICGLQIKITECKSGYAGSFRMGITDINILNAHVNRSLPPSISCLPHYTAYIDGNTI